MSSLREEVFPAELIAHTFYPAGKKNIHESRKSHKIIVEGRNFT